ncbi:hypothetical protein BD779DRAFT_1684767, partial [Infundibulicybe gibba]
MSTTTKVSLGLSLVLFLELAGAAPVPPVPSTPLDAPPETTQWLWDCDDNSDTPDPEVSTSINISSFASISADPQPTAIGPELEGVIPPASLPTSHTNHSSHTPALIAAVLGGMVVFSVLLLALSKSRFCLGRLSPLDPSEPKKSARRYRDLKKRNLIGAPTHVGIPAWRRFPPLYSPTSASSASASSDTSSKDELRVIDITAEQPKSRFSVTSSDYEDAYESFSPRSSFGPAPVEAAKHGRRHS